jgi:hypothetical protein
MSAYETSVTIPSFAGINQAGDGYNQSMRYARVMENVNVSGGSFTPMREGLRLEQTLDKPIGTLAYLHRRYLMQGTERTLLVAISDGKVYTKALDNEDEWVQRYSGLTDNDCDWITYEVNREGDNDQQGTPSPVDVLLFTNATDGMFCLYGDDLHVEPVETPYKFGVLARFNERIWGAGITDMPDSLVYSAPYDPFDWEAQAEIPEDGAGEIMQPSWDGDSFVALRQVGNYLMAFKRNAVWRVYGTNPGEFVIQQQYGGGTIEENTVAVADDHVYMLGAKGIMRYDGSGVTPFMQDNVQDIIASVNTAALDKCVAGMRNGVYCVALPVNGSEFCNAILEYNTREYTFAFRTGVTVDTFLQINERLLYTSATEPGKLFELRDDIGQPLPVIWKSGMQDLGLKNAIKSAFILYMMVETETPAPIYIGIRTEKKLKQKVVMVCPGKATRVHLSNRGRVFSLELKSLSSVPFKIAGGVKIDLELDPD